MNEKPTEPFSTEAEALATAIYEDNVNSWFEAKRMLVAALQSAYERGRNDERERCARLANHCMIKFAGIGFHDAEKEQVDLCRRDIAAAIMAMKQEAGE